MDLEIVGGAYAVCRLGPSAEVPVWAARGPIVVVVRSAEELSLVCDETDVPIDVEATRGWRALRVAGTLHHALTGILAALATPLAEVEIPIFAVSTFDTDYLLVPGERFDDALEALAAAGHLTAR